MLEKHLMDTSELKQPKYLDQMEQEAALVCTCRQSAKPHQQGEVALSWGRLVLITQEQERIPYSTQGKEIQERKRVWIFKRAASFI